LTLGVGAGVGYTYGGPLGEKLLGFASKAPSESAKAGARLGGRIALSLGLIYVLDRVL
jgi:hypothetical protein